jgi:hypothetical protein
MSTSRKLILEDLVGKTVKSAACEPVNYLILTFTDGTTLELETENEGYEIYGIMVQEKEVKPC